MNISELNKLIYARIRTDATRIDRAHKVRTSKTGTPNAKLAKYINLVRVRKPATAPIHTITINPFVN